MQASAGLLLVLAAAWTCIAASAGQKIRLYARPANSSSSFFLVASDAAAAAGKGFLARPFAPSIGHEHHFPVDCLFIKEGAMSRALSRGFGRGTCLELTAKELPIQDLGGSPELAMVIKDIVCHFCFMQGFDAV